MNHFQKYGLIGQRLTHSFSKDFFSHYFLENQIQASYENLEFDDEASLSTFFKQTIHQYHGLNITIPYKETVLPFLDELSDEASHIKAVNTIQLIDNKLIGHNTDAFGFHQSIKPFLTNKHERAIIFGTGGSSKAVYFILKKIGIDCIFISRNPQGVNQFAYEEINEHMLRACKLIVHCTPTGMFPKIEDVIPFPFQHLTPEHLVVDLIYNPFKSKLLALSERQGAMILNGETMLKEQALASFAIWQSPQLG